MIDFKFVEKKILLLNSKMNAINGADTAWVIVSRLNNYFNNYELWVEILIFLKRFLLDLFSLWYIIFRLLIKDGAE